MVIRPISGNEMVRNLKNRQLYILTENENCGLHCYRRPPEREEGSK